MYCLTLHDVIASGRRCELEGEGVGVGGGGEGEGGGRGGGKEEGICISRGN